VARVKYLQINLGYYESFLLIENDMRG